MRLCMWLTLVVSTVCVLVHAANQALQRMDVDAHLPYATLPTDPLTVHDLELSNVLVVTTLDGRLHGLDRTSGRVLWSFQANEDSLHTSPLVASTYQHRTMEQLAKDARDHGDSTLLRALQGGGFYVVEPSQAGHLYLLHIPVGATKPVLDKLPFSLPELVSMSPFSLHSDDPRIFVAEKRTSLMELNVFTGTVRAVYSGSSHEAAGLVDKPLPARPRVFREQDTHAPLDTDDDTYDVIDEDDDAIESPWVYVGRTDYTLKVHVRHVPQAEQSVHYHVYTPNMADRDVVQLWHQMNQPADHRAILSSPENATLICFDLRLARNPQRHSMQPMPPVLWSVRLGELPVDIYDVVFAPSAMDAPLLRPALVPHSPGILSTIVEQQLRRDPRDQPDQQDKPTSSSSSSSSSTDEYQLNAFIGSASDGSLFALSSARYPLAGLSEHAAILRGSSDARDPAMDSSRVDQKLLRPWIGGYRVRSPVLSPQHALPMLGAASQPILQLEAPVQAPVSRAPWFTKWRIAQLAGLMLILLIIYRGCYFIWRDSQPKYLDISSLAFPDTRVPPSSPPMKDKAVGVSTATTLAATPATTSPPTPTLAGGTTIVRSSSSEQVEEESSTHASPPILDPQTPQECEADPKRRRRRRGKRAGAAVLARQARREESVEPASPLRSAVDSAKALATAQTSLNAEPAANSSIHALAPESASSALVPSDASHDTPASLVELPSTSLQISDEVLGYGSSGTVVFRGTFQGRAVAVKRLLRDFVHLASKEVSLLQSADNHPNVIRYYCQELTPNFLYIALEECPASLADLIERPLDHTELASLLEPRQAFKQITAGLVHLHSLSIVHRDIKPGNILVSLTSQQKLRVLLSDFGLSKKIDGLSFSAQTQSAHAGGTIGWRAPELLRGHDTASGPICGRERLTRAVDIFSLGCVAYYMLTRGAHPFGEMYEREMHILQNKVDLHALTASGDDIVEAEALIMRMIDTDATKRPTASDVARHPFFWNAAKRVAFLQDVSDRFETLERNPPAFALELLEQNASSVVGTDWRRRFDRTFLDDLGKFRTYNSASVQDLLRVLRNKKHHFQDMPLALKKQLSPMPEGFLSYFTRRFPALFLHVYHVVERLPQLRSEPIFASYYESEDAS